VPNPVAKTHIIKNETSADDNDYWIKLTRFQ
jgi:hypothetical protein